ncbi:hypothetical protein, partial [Streptomyces anulatus]|uniref:hypothetical protein n=1 Tax=Streptomyces anulatus TaxID=1892 RepID=UPI0034197412
PPRLTAAPIICPGGTGVSRDQCPVSRSSALAAPVALLAPAASTGAVGSFSDVPGPGSGVGRTGDLG